MWRQENQYEYEQLALRQRGRVTLLRPLMSSTARKVCAHWRAERARPSGSYIVARQAGLPLQDWKTLESMPQYTHAPPPEDGNWWPVWPKTMSAHGRSPRG